MIEGTQVLWSVVCYVAALAGALCLALCMRAIAAPSTAQLDKTSGATDSSIVVLSVISALAVLAFVRFVIWAPLHTLYDAIGDKQLFLYHCRSAIRPNLPYALLILTVLSLSALQAGTLITVLQLALMLGAHWSITVLRNAAVNDSVNALMRRI